MLVKVKSKGGKFISIYIMLGSGGESTLIQADFIKRLELDGKTNLADICNIKGTEETTSVKEVKFQIMD